MSSPPQDDQPQKSGAEGEQLNNGLEEGSVADQPGYRKSVWVPGGMRERQRRIMTRIMVRRSMQLTTYAEVVAGGAASPQQIARSPAAHENSQLRSSSDGGNSQVQHSLSPSSPSTERADQPPVVNVYPPYDPEVEYSYHYEDDDTLEDVDLKESEIW